MGLAALGLPYGQSGVVNLDRDGSPQAAPARTVSGRVPREFHGQDVGLAETVGRVERLRRVDVIQFGKRFAIERHSRRSSETVEGDVNPLVRFQIRRLLESTLKLDAT